MHKPYSVTAVVLLSMSTVYALSGCANPSVGSAPSAGNAPSVSGQKADVHQVSKISTLVPEIIRKKGYFTAAINPEVVPVKFINNQGNIDGFNPDLLRAAAKVMGVKVKLQRATFDSLVPGMKAKRFDVIASIGDFKARRGQIDFIDYMTAGDSILTSTSFKRDKAKPSDLCGVSIAYIRGTLQQVLISKASKQCVKKGREPLKPTGYGDSGAALLAVKSGRTQAFWGDTPSVLYNVKAHPDLYKVIYKKNNVYYGIGVNKQDQKLEAALHDALLELSRSGAYKKLLEKWGLQAQALPKFPVNSGKTPIS